MSEKIYHYTVSIIFGALTVVHIARALQGWEAQIASTPIPVWVSWVSAVISAYLTLRGLSLGHKDHQRAKKNDGDAPGSSM